MVADPIGKLTKDTEELEPGTMKVGDYVQKPQAAEGVAPDKPGMVVSALESAGYQILWNTLTYESTTFNKNMVPWGLRETREDGSLVYTDKYPGQDPWRGTIKCFLHPDQPERPHYDDMGFPVCQKATMPTQYEADNHASGRHSKEWKAVEADRERREREEDRALQREIAMAMSNAQGGRGRTLQEVEKDKARMAGIRATKRAKEDARKVISG